VGHRRSHSQGQRTNTISGSRNRSCPTLIDATEKPDGAVQRRRQQRLAEFPSAMNAFIRPHNAGTRVATLNPAPGDSPTNGDTMPGG
jgi:hypothetical protein